MNSHISLELIEEGRCEPLNCTELQPHKVATLWNFGLGVEAALAGMLYYAQW